MRKFPMTAAILAMTLMVAAPAAASARTNTSLAACRTADGSVRTTITWSGFATNDISVLLAYDDGQGYSLGFDGGDGFSKAVRSGTWTQTFIGTWDDGFGNHLALVSLSAELMRIGHHSSSLPVGSTTDFSTPC